MTSEDLLAISQLLDVKLETHILPRLRNIEDGYVPACERHKKGIGQLDSMQADIAVMKNVLMKHGDKIRRFA